MMMWHASGGRSRRPPLRRAQGLLAVLAATIVALLGTAPPAAADEIRDRQWHLDFLNIAEAHQITRGQGVIVAVVDTGVQADHPDLQGNVLRGKDFVTGGDGRNDEDGHGTRMANVIAGHGHGNGEGVLGIAPKAKILPVGIKSKADGAEIAEAVRWAVDHGAQVINMSIGTTGETPALQSAIAYAQSKNIVLVGSAGNSFAGDYTIGPPATYPGVIAVSAIGRSGQFAPNISVQGEPIDLAAPGEEISTADAKGPAISKGTSDSAAIVSGTAALVRARYPDLDAADVINRLVKTADDKGPQGRDPQYGLGVVNPIQALTADVPRVTENPLGTLAEEPAQPNTPPADTPTAQAAPGDDGGTGGGTNPLLIAIIIAVAAAAIAAVVGLLLINRTRRRPATAPTAGPGPPPPPGSSGPYPPPPGQPPYGPPPTGPPRQSPPHWPPPPDQR